MIQKFLTDRQHLALNTLHTMLVLIIEIQDSAMEDGIIPRNHALSKRVFIPSEKKTNFLLSGEGRITLFKSTLDVIGYPEYYRFLFNPEDRLFAVQKCGMSDPGSNRLGRVDQYHFAVKTMDLVRFVYYTCRRKQRINYRVAGVAFPEDQAVQFDLTEAFEIHEGRVCRST